MSHGESHRDVTPESQRDIGRDSRGRVRTREVEEEKDLTRAVGLDNANGADDQLEGEPGPDDDEPEAPEQQPFDLTHLGTLIDPAYLQEHIP